MCIYINTEYCPEYSFKSDLYLIFKLLWRNFTIVNIV